MHRRRFLKSSARKSALSCVAPEGYLDLLVIQWAIVPMKPARGGGSTTVPGPATLYLESVG